MLLDIAGKPLIQRVYEQARKVQGIQKILIATDHDEVFQSCINFGAEVIMTSDKHISGTDRLGEVANKINDFDIFINIQGDEPLIDPLMIEKLNKKLANERGGIVTLYEKISNEEEIFDYNVVKLTKNLDNKILYFSRNAIPAFRDTPYKEWLKKSIYYRHIGVYGFQSHVLKEIVKLKPSMLEQAESLEQLRWLENGYDVYGIEGIGHSIGVDTEEDLERVRALFATK
jgi:3-deoxy-manno-octulosonate cytidylyltransferase (CMP-KDO synthetase)